MVEDKESTYRLLRDEHDNDAPEDRVTQLHQPFAWLTRLHLGILLAISCLINAFLVLLYLENTIPACLEKPTEFAGLTYDRMLPWEDRTQYNTGNYSEQDLLWGELRADSGIIALTKSYAAEHGLHRGSPFPWDSEKEIYLINGFHSIHCLSQLYLALKEYREGLPQSRPFEHSVHCLDWLRGDIMCRADDTPLYTTTSRHADSGFGQFRKCKDWNKLVSWAEEHTACYRNGHFVVEDKLESQVGRFKFCPKDSPYLDKIRRYYGKGEDWFPSDEKIYIPH
ncbi:hypothetical protein K469DRAFT_661066 [Zopfia rhizophila CBS 207.26]|uniref:Uncharacterized protein n=1 Tax=Zopfia rhizophila CBS 207.26 TaxID=1314779 RepID=A0A6A6EDZ4_9PEZI|nr:hypothetical protein K469DRAFT_661066 [Zopfia rhizophila CBS 207.26]